MYLSQWLFKGTITWLITRCPKDIIFISQSSTKINDAQNLFLLYQIFPEFLLLKITDNKCIFLWKGSKGGGVYSCTVEHLDRLFSLHPSMIIQMATTTMILLKVVNSMVGVNDEILDVSFRLFIGRT